MAGRRRPPDPPGTDVAKPRIVVTGTGAVCAAGMRPDAILDAVRAGQSAIGPVRQWDTAGWPVRDAGEVADFDARKLVDDRKLHKLIRRTDLFGLYAAGAAIDASGILPHRASQDEAAAAIYSDRTGVYVGSGGGSYQNSTISFRCSPPPTMSCRRSAASSPTR